MCRVATEYASYVIFRLNEGYNVFNSVIYDGLTARAGVAKVYWEEKYDLHRGDLRRPLVRRRSRARRAG
jgi:hypothetical protein